jgi:acetyltransferase-like isoleucine patch superfamily enzyme
MASKLARAAANPFEALGFVISLIRSRWCVLKYQHILHRATFGRKFRITSGGRLSIVGPGKVIFGDNVSVGMYVTPWTYHKDARIIIGDGSFVNGTRFACQSRVEIGKRCILAECRIMDTDFHGVDPNNRESFVSKPISIGDNVWITINSVILKGVTIGSGSTITPNSVVLRDVPGNAVAGGNPVEVIKTFP